MSEERGVEWHEGDEGRSSAGVEREKGMTFILVCRHKRFLLQLYCC